MNCPTKPPSAKARHAQRRTRYYIRWAFKAGLTEEDIFNLSKIDPWFLRCCDDSISWNFVGSGGETTVDLGKVEDILFRQAALNAQRM